MNSKNTNHTANWPVRVLARILRPVIVEVIRQDVHHPGSPLRQIVQKEIVALLQSHLALLAATKSGERFGIK